MGSHQPVSCALASFKMWLPALSSQCFGHLLASNAQRLENGALKILAVVQQAGNADALHTLRERHVELSAPRRQAWRQQHIGRRQRQALRFEQDGLPKALPEIGLEQLR